MTVIIAVHVDVAARKGVQVYAVVTQLHLDIICKTVNITELIRFLMKS